MIRLGTNWYITLADLSLILFMATASAVHQDAAPVVEGNPLPAEGEPVAVYRAGPQAPPIREWLAGQAMDDRLRLTIIAHHATGDTAALAAQATQLAIDAGPDGADARIVVEPGPQNEVLAVLSYDRAPEWHAGCSDQGSRKDKSCE